MLKVQFITKFYNLRKILNTYLPSYINSCWIYIKICYNSLYISALIYVNANQNHLLKTFFQINVLCPTDSLYIESILNINMTHFHRICLLVFRNVIYWKYFSEYIENTNGNQKIYNTHQKQNLTTVKKIVISVIGLRPKPCKYTIFRMFNYKIH